MDFLPLLAEVGVFVKDPSSPDPKEKPGVDMAGEAGEAELFFPFLDTGV